MSVLSPSIHRSTEISVVLYVITYNWSLQHIYAYIKQALAGLNILRFTAYFWKWWDLLLMAELINIALNLLSWPTNCEIIEKDCRRAFCVTVSGDIWSIMGFLVHRLSCSEVEWNPALSPDAGVSVTWIVVPVTPHVLLRIFLCCDIYNYFTEHSRTDALTRIHENVCLLAFLGNCEPSARSHCHRRASSYICAH